MVSETKNKKSKKTRIFIIDDHSVVREGLKRIINENPGMEVNQEAADGDEALKKIKKNNSDLIILDISMPGKNGLEVLTDIKKIKPNLPVLILTMHSEEQYAQRMFNAGAKGYLRKDYAPDKIIEAIDVILKGKKYVNKSQYEIIKRSKNNPHKSLNNTEFDVFRKIVEGKSVFEIAVDDGITNWDDLKKVREVRSSILKKMNLKSNKELKKYAKDRNLEAS
tara:strand:- start:20674 stop:21339 length:666 start_codon:yes stop_codon:yes gene_type:complete